MRPLHLHRNRGFTLMELLIVIAIIGVVGVVVGKFSADVFSYNRTFNGTFSTIDDAEKLLRPMTQEIRSASASNTGAYAIDAIGDYSFSFYSDIDNDGLKEWIRYSLSGTTMSKEVIKPSGNPLTYNQASKVTTTFLSNVQNQAASLPIFTYYDSTYTGGAGGVVSSSGALDSIRLIGITVRLDADPIKPPAAVDVTTKVSIRNLKQQQ